MPNNNLLPQRRVEPYIRPVLTGAAGDLQLDKFIATPDRSGDGYAHVRQQVAVLALSPDARRPGRRCRLPLYLSNY